MEGGNQISLALERVLLPYTRFPEADQPKLNIAVGFTSVEATLAALRRAGLLASSLGARITLHVPQLVPYPLPLERPPVLLDWNQRRFRVIAGASPVETVVRLYLAGGDRRPQSVVAIHSREEACRGITASWPRGHLHRNGNGMNIYA